MGSRNATVFIVDDEPEVRSALVSLLTVSGYRVQAFETPQRFLREVDPETPGCLVLDLQMPVLSGLDVQRALEDASHYRSIVFLSGHATVPTSVLAMKAGAVDFLMKPVEKRFLLAAIDQALARDATERSARSAQKRVRERARRLTPREREVLAHLLRGRLNKQIAADLGTVEKTIKVHRGRILHKMGVRSVVELVHLAHDADVARTPASAERASTADEVDRIDGA